MIGSHNSMTYLKASSKVWEKLSAYWRCQDKTIDEQIAAGVRWFDIRVAYDKSARGSSFWKFAHGEVDLQMTVKTGSGTGRSAGSVRLTLDDVLTKIQNAGGLVRIMLEKGDADDETLFAEYFSQPLMCKKWPCIIGAVIKENWRVLWNKRPDLGITDCSYVPYKRDTPVLKQLKAILKFPFKSIKKRADEGFQPTKAQREHQYYVWVYDYV